MRKNKCIIVVFLLLFSVGWSSSPKAEELRDVLLSAMDSYNNGDCEGALPQFKRILSSDLPPVKEDAELEYSLNYYAGYCARKLGDYENAFNYFALALRGAKQLNLDSQVPVISGFLADVSTTRGDYERGITLYQSALTKLDAKSLDAGIVWYFLGEAYREADNYNLALSCAERALKIADHHNNDGVAVSSLISSGKTYYLLSDYPNSAAKFTLGLARAQAAQLPKEMADNHLGLGMIYSDAQKSELARQSFNDALRLYIASGDTKEVPLIVDELLGLPALDSAAIEGELAQYMQYLDSGTVNDPAAAASLWMLAGVLQSSMNDNEGATDSYRLAVQNASVAGDVPEMVRSAILLSDLRFAMRDYKGAESVLKAVSEHTLIAEQNEWLARVYSKLGWLNDRMQRNTLAKDYYRKALSYGYASPEADEYQRMLDAVE